MKTIWKYPILQQVDGLLGVTDRPVIKMPHGAEILTVQVQLQPTRAIDGFREVPTIWALVDPEAEVTNHGFLIVGTGNEVPQDVEGLPVQWSTYVGTWQQENGTFVFHLFDRGEIPDHDDDGGT